MAGKVHVHSTAILVTSPAVYSNAGIFHGRYFPGFDQDFFLGIKYASKPVRFAPASLISETPDKYINATQYGLDCKGYESDTDALVAGGWTKMGEDCLHLNVVKPATNETNLPVLL